MITIYSLLMVLITVYDNDHTYSLLMVLITVYDNDLFTPNGTYHCV